MQVFTVTVVSGTVTVTVDGGPGVVGVGPVVVGPLVVVVTVEVDVSVVVVVPPQALKASAPAISSAANTKINTLFFMPGPFVRMFLYIYITKDR
jgi:hypothetical protein